MIAAVDLKVSEYEKKQKWLEILNKIENKTYTKLKNGHVFRKQALMSKERTLLYDGLVYWKTATGRFKGTVALTDQFFSNAHYSFNRGQIFQRKMVQQCRHTHKLWVSGKISVGSSWKPQQTEVAHPTYLRGEFAAPRQKAS